MLNFDTKLVLKIREYKTDNKNSEYSFLAVLITEPRSAIVIFIAPCVMARYVTPEEEGFQRFTICSYGHMHAF